MNYKKLFKTIPAKQFFNNFCPEVKNFYHKSRGVDGNKKIITFSAEDHAAIDEGIKRFIVFLKKNTTKSKK